MTIAKFEDLDTWKLARELTGLVYRATNMNGLQRDFGLRNQMQRAADLGYLEQSEFQDLFELAERIKMTIGGLTRYLWQH